MQAPFVFRCEQLVTKSQYTYTLYYVHLLGHIVRDPAAGLVGLVHHLCNRLKAVTTGVLRQEFRDF